MYNCPNCAGNLVFDIASQKLMCEFCKTQLDPYEYQKTQDAEENDMFGVTVYTCPQCGGEIMTTNVTAAGFCTYCGASTILDSRMRNEKRPAHIIPFSKTKEDCRRSYTSLVKRALFAPREFRDPEFLDRFRGIYIPYWVYNCDFTGELRLTGSRTYRRGDYRITDHYRLSGEVDARYHGLTYDASSSFDDTVASEIAPFEAAKLKPFTPSILCGFYADAPDVDSSVYHEAVLDSISEDSIERLSGVSQYRKSGADMPSSDEFKGQLRGGSNMDLKEDTPTCAYLPVWFLTYRKKDRVAYAVMNGSTGKITADLPIDEKKYVFGSLLLAVPIFALLAFFLTMTGQMVLTASSVLALLSLVIYFLEVSDISDKDSHAHDKGFKSVNRTPKSAGNTDSGEKKNDKSPSALLKKYGKYALIILVLILVFPRLGLEFIMDSASLTAFKIYGGVSVILLLVVILLIVTMAETEMARKNLFLQIAGSVIAVAAAGAILVWNPVSDLWFYGGSILAAIGVCLTFLGIISKYNILATRPLPTFYDRKGGNDRAK